MNSLVTTITYPHFEDVTPIRSSSQSKCSSDDLRTIYDLMENIRIENEENAIEESAIIEKFKENKILSCSHFKIIAHDRDYPIITTFCHMACKKNAKKVLDWFISEFPGLSFFENNSINLNADCYDYSKCLDSPLNYVIENLPDNESNRCIVSKLAKNYYAIRKKSVNSYDISTLSNEQTNGLKKRPNIVFTDQVFRNGEDQSLNFWSNVFFRALINGKHLMYETMLETYVEKEEVTKIIADCSSMPRDLVAIVYEYALFVITPKVQDILSLTIEGPGKCGFELYNSLSFVIVHLHASCNLNRKIQLIKTAKLLLDYNENLEKIPSLVDCSNPDNDLNRPLWFENQFDSFPYLFELIPNLIYRIKNDDENALATKFMNCNRRPLYNLAMVYRQAYSSLIRFADK